MSKEIAVTGPNSTVGAVLLEVARQHYPEIKPVLLPRNLEYAAEMSSRGYDVRPIDDLVDEPTPSLMEKIKGLDGIIHLAASSTQKNDWRLHYRNIYLATTNVSYSAATEGIPLILIGSSSQYAGSKEKIFDHNTQPYSESAYPTLKNEAFYDSVRIGESMVNVGENYKVIELIPGAVLGPTTNWVDNLRRISTSPFLSRLFLNTQLAWTDAEDLSHAALKAAQDPQKAASNRYIVMSGHASTNQIGEFFCDLEGKKPPATPLPKHLFEPPIRGLISIAERLAPLTGKYPPLSSEVFSFGLHGEDFKFVSDAFIKDYDWQQTPLEQTLSKIKAEYKPKSRK